MGDPAAAVAWLANTLTARGEHLPAGSVVLSGGLTASVALNPGGNVVAEFDGLGSVEVHSLRRSFNARSRPGIRRLTAVVYVEISPANVSVEVRDGETLLRAIVRSGYKYRYGCRRGGCGFCKVQLVLGEVTYERPIDPRVLTDDEKVLGICLSCRAVPLTNVVIELQEGDRLRGVPQSDGSADSRQRLRR
jgi:ferredoxin